METTEAKKGKLQQTEMNITFQDSGGFKISIRIGLRDFNVVESRG